MGDVYSSEFSEVDDDNDSASGAGWPESMRPGNVNNAARALQGAIKRFVDQQTPKTTTGTSTAYLLAYSVAPGALADGMTVLVEFDQACGNAPTLNINSLGAKSLYKFAAGEWVALVAGDLISGQVVRLSYNQTSGVFRILQPLNVVPTGTTLGYRGTSSQVPAGWLIENGGSIGDAGSGGTNLASAACEALFKLLWPNSNYSVQDSDGTAATKGSTASDDWTAHKRLVLTNMSDKFRRGATVTPGGTGGSDTHTHTVSTSVSVSVSVSGTTFGNNSWFTLGNLNGGGSNTFPSQGHTHNFSASGSGSGSGSGTAASGSNVPAYVYELSIIKL